MHTKAMKDLDLLQSNEVTSVMFRCLEKGVDDLDYHS